MSNHKAPELHIIDGTKPSKPLAMIPNNIKNRIPKAEWLDNPDGWNKLQFIEETSDFLYEVYGIGSNQDKHTLSILADQIDLYVQCSKGIAEEGIIANYNNGATVASNPHILIRNKAITLILQIMNELGLTPRTRLANTKKDEANFSSLLKGAGH
jgi:P27 family predicted phage terminase small subunit